MSPIQRSLIPSLIKGFAVAALLLVGASAVHAQGYVPNSSPYACTWRLATGATGVSLLTFTYTSNANGISRGTVQYIYQNAPQALRGFEFYPDIYTGNYIYKQDNGITCQMQVFYPGREVVFTDCTPNGVLQNCRQWQ